MCSPLPGWLHRAASGFELDVRVIPRARRTELAGVRDGALLVRLAAPPVEGAANEALLTFLADRLRLPRRALRLLSGQTSRRKRVRVTGASEAEVRQRLELAG